MPTVCHRPVAAATRPEATRASVPTSSAVRTGTMPAAIGSGALHRVQPIGLDVEGVVPQVEPARRQAEGDEREERLPELRPVVEHARRAGSGEHEQVLAPLQRPGRADQADRPTTRRRRPERPLGHGVSSSTITSPTPRGRRRRAVGASPAESP